MLIEINKSYYPHLPSSLLRPFLSSNPQSLAKRKTIAPTPLSAFPEPFKVISLSP